MFAILKHINSNLGKLTCLKTESLHLA